ncbi:hypothetical protein [Nesterenkonia flava]|uniref:DUF3040 domain-containing protein n=1 Tax=Nesterenkonia flava TaxID=469799 RepID=A0ABU1FUY0_9MICC|nr:hypothetical protein [Nesterenkonia flava]MDR5712456.1 hypothetical protein [Nesterenkonia flava]
MNRKYDGDPTRPIHQPSHPTTPLPPDPEDVDALLAESLKAQSEADFTWKEPERRPRWWERAQMQQAGPAAAPANVTPSGSVVTSAYSASARASGPRLASAIFGAICLLLALWTLMSLLTGFTLDPMVLALGICTLAGLALVLAGLSSGMRRTRRRL